MSTPFTMPTRRERDGAVGVSRIDDDTLAITVTDDGVPQSMKLSRYNATRIFGMLAFTLRIPLPKALGKAITF